MSGGAQGTPTSMGGTTSSQWQPAASGKGGLPQNSQSGYGQQGQSGWAPAFNQWPQTPQMQSAQPVYPQLYGGPYNQMTQMMAGPQYQALPQSLTQAGQAGQAAISPPASPSATLPIGSPSSSGASPGTGNNLVWSGYGYIPQSQLK